MDQRTNRALREVPDDPVVTLDHNKKTLSVLTGALAVLFCLAIALFAVENYQQGVTIARYEAMMKGKAVPSGTTGKVVWHEPAWKLQGERFAVAVDPGNGIVHTGVLPTEAEKLNHSEQPVSIDLAEGFYLDRDGKLQSLGVVPIARPK